MRVLSIAVVGSGVAGSVLARILARQGHQVFLFERGAHPRFALGESSTPLAAICLERLADRYDLADLRWLAAYGRWTRHLPELRRGLKRGFSFYAHRPGQPYRNDERNSHRLLVAASPADELADAHWLRADVDRHLVERASDEGVEYVDRIELEAPRRTSRGFRLQGVRLGRRMEVETDILLDASGRGGFLARHLPVPAHPTPRPLRTSLTFGHFENVTAFDEVAEAGGARLPTGPYPDERAAVHHLLDEGWMYVLPFDHGVVSAGFVVEQQADGRRARSTDGAAEWRRLLDRYPTLRAQFADARPARPVERVECLQHRLSRVAGGGWAVLPHGYSFLSPMFSTGIAWSLLGVERLTRTLETGTPSFDRYASLLEREADHMERLITGAYALRRRFDRFAAYSLLYFVAASYMEAAQRLCPEPPAADAWAGEGFLGATDATLCEAIAWAGWAAFDPEVSDPAFRAALCERLGPRDVAGLTEPNRNRAYPVVFDPLIAHADRLGLTESYVRANLDRLRGAA